MWLTPTKRTRPLMVVLSSVTYTEILEISAEKHTKVYQTRVSENFHTRFSTNFVHKYRRFSDISVQDTIMNSNIVYFHNFHTISISRRSATFHQTANILFMNASYNSTFKSFPITNVLRVLCGNVTYSNEQNHLPSTSYSFCQILHYTPICQFGNQGSIRSRTHERTTYLTRESHHLMWQIGLFCISINKFYKYLYV